ncbi:MAG: hypothetical protein ABIC36_03095 [bacterium]
MDTTAIILILYLATMFFVAWYFSKKESLEDYFANQRKTNIWFMTLSTVATVVGAGATVAIVSEVYNTGISYGIALPISFIVGMFVLGVLARYCPVKILPEAQLMTCFFNFNFIYRSSIK